MCLHDCLGFCVCFPGRSGPHVTRLQFRRSLGPASVLPGSRNPVWSGPVVNDSARKNPETNSGTKL